MSGSSLLQYISRDAVDALREFSSEFDQALALAEVQQWSKTLGRCVLVNSSRAIKTTYPIPISAFAFEELKGDDKMSQLYAKSLSMTPREWQSGVKEKALVIEAPDFVGWTTAPSDIAREAQRQPNILLVEMLEANPVLDFYAGTDHSALTLFDNDHPHNVFDASFDTFDNDRGSISGFSQALLIDFRTHFRNIKGPNGKPMGRRLTDIVVPPALEEEAKQFLESDLMYNATLAGTDNTQLTSNNIYKGSVNLIVADELSADDVVYGVDRNGPAFAILQDGGSPEEIVFDKTSDMYKRQGMLGISYRLLMAVGAALPHSVCRATIT